VPVFFFIDESRQTISGATVAALGCVAIPAAAYNRLCRVVYRAKQEVLGARELQDKELKGNVNFCRAAFTAQEVNGTSPSLVAVERVMQAVRAAAASVISVVTVAPIDVSIRSRESSLLTDPYVDLVLRMHELMKKHPRRRGLLFFDQVGHREDQRAACAIQNLFVRTRFSHELSKLFIQLPHFTHSCVSPGLQVADLIAYLSAHTVDDFRTRPELRPWWGGFSSLGYDVTMNGERRRSVDPFDALPPRQGNDRRTRRF
jgi:hypothetical protein